MRFDVYHHFSRDDNKLDQILAMLTKLTQMGQQELTKMAVIDDAVTALNAKVTAEGDVITSAETLLTNLSQMLKDALAGGVSQATIDQVNSIAASIDAKSSELAAAVAANTPAAPAPPTP